MCDLMTGTVSAIHKCRPMHIAGFVFRSSELNSHSTNPLFHCLNISLAAHFQELKKLGKVRKLVFC